MPQPRGWWQPARATREHFMVPEVGPSSAGIVETGRYTSACGSWGALRPHPLRDRHLPGHPARCMRCYRIARARGWVPFTTPGGEHGNT